jgi:cobalamin synthase
MELIERLIRPPWGSMMWGFVLGLGTTVAVLGFGAPGWILVPVSWIGITIFFYAKRYVYRHTGGRRY